MTSIGQERWDRYAHLEISKYPWGGQIFRGRLKIEGCPQRAILPRAENGKELWQLFATCSKEESGIDKNPLEGVWEVDMYFSPYIVALIIGINCLR